MTGWMTIRVSSTERTVQGLGHGLRLLGIGIGGVWVEFLEHATNGVFNKLLLVDLVNIKGLDGHLGNTQFAQLALGSSTLVGNNHLG